MTDETTSRPPPIYVSYLTFTNLLDWLHDVGTLPTQFDRSYWGHKFSGSGGAQLMAGLRFLGLLKGDAPTPELERLALGDGEDRRELLKELLRQRYGPEFVDGLARATPRLLNEHLESLGTTDATHAKARSFFVNAAKAVGLPMPPQIAKQARNRPTVTRKPSGQRRHSTDEQGTGGGADVDKTSTSPTKTALPVHAALEPLLRDLAQIGATWSAAERARWKATWDAVLDYAYPEAAKEGSGQ